MDSLFDILGTKKYAIFDLDGTIANTEPLHWNIDKEILKDMYGVDLTHDKVKNYSGLNNIQFFELMDRDFNIRIDRDKVEELHTKMFKEWVIDTNLKPYELVTNCIERFNGEINLLSNQKPSIIHWLLDLWGIEDRFKNIVSLSSTLLSKEDVVYHLGDPFSSIWFEDNIRMAQIGKRIGYTVVFVNNPYNYDINFKVDFIIDPIEVVKNENMLSWR